MASFKATLEETIHADLLLHVVDAGSAVRVDQIEQVNLVLKEIGADHIPSFWYGIRSIKLRLSPDSNGMSMVKSQEF